MRRGSDRYIPRAESTHTPPYVIRLAIGSRIPLFVTRGLAVSVERLIVFSQSVYRSAFGVQVNVTRVRDAELRDNAFGGKVIELPNEIRIPKTLKVLIVCFDMVLSKCLAKTAGRDQTSCNDRNRRHRMILDEEKGNKGRKEVV